jgi:hypothetical protein
MEICQRFLLGSGALYAFLHPIFTICCHKSQNIAILATASLDTVKNTVKNVAMFLKSRVT